MDLARTAAPDAIGDLLGDWRISLRARGRSAATIADYLIVGQSFAS